MPLGGIDPYLETFEVNIPMMKQKTTYNGKTREIRRVLIDSSHPFARGWVQFVDFRSFYKNYMFHTQAHSPFISLLTIPYL